MALALVILIPAFATSAVPTAKKDNVAEQKTVSSPHQYTQQASLVTGAPITITVVASSSQEASARSAISAALSRALTFDRDFFSDNGIESQLTNLKRGQTVSLSQDGFDFVSRAIDLAILTGGWFDITAPSPKSLFQKKDWRRIALDSNTRTISFKSSGMLVDAKKVAPGFVADLVIDELVKQGFTNAKVEVGPVHKNSGRDIFTPWSIQIGFGEKTQEDNAFRAYRYDISNVAAATVTPEGLGNGLIDPGNKKQISSRGLRSVTIFAADAMTANAFALAAYTIGPKYGMQFVEAHPETRGIMVDPKGRLLASHGINFIPAPERQDIEQTGPNGGSNDLRQKEREESQEQ